MCVCGDCGSGDNYGVGKIMVTVIVAEVTVCGWRWW